MGSRSRSARQGRRHARKPRPASPQVEFYREALEVIAHAVQGKQLTWNQRALLWTRLPSQLPGLCERFDAGVRSEAFIMVLHRLGSSKHLEFFDRDILKHLIKLLQEITADEGGITCPPAVAELLVSKQLVSNSVVDAEMDGAL